MKFTPQDVFITALSAKEQKEILYKPDDAITSKNRITGNEFIDQFAHCMSINMMNKVGFYERELGLKAGVLYKIIPSFSGITQGEWCDQYILLAAKELLTVTEYDLRTIALRLGFASYKSFSRWFVRLTNEGPSICRKRAVRLRKREDTKLLQQIKKGTYKCIPNKENEPENNAPTEQ